MWLTPSSRPAQSSSVSPSGVTACVALREGLMLKCLCLCEAPECSAQAPLDVGCWQVTGRLQAQKLLKIMHRGIVAGCSACISWGPGSSQRPPHVRGARSRPVPLVMSPLWTEHSASRTVVSASQHGLGFCSQGEEGTSSLQVPAALTVHCPCSLADVLQPA